MNLYLLRHAIAVEAGAPGCSRDADRRLSEEGIRKLESVAIAMRGMGLEIEVVLTSPYVRARETARYVARVLGGDIPLVEAPSLSPSGTPASVARSLKALAPMPENVLLVGHEPNLGELASWLLSGNTRAQIRFKKAGLCRLSCAGLNTGARATLEWLLTPRQLSLMT